MTEKERAKIEADEVKQTNFTTSFGNLKIDNDERGNHAYRENHFLRIIVKLFVVVQIIFELRHLRHIGRFAANMSFETVIHFSLHQFCMTFEISHSVINALDWFFYVSSISLWINMLFGLLLDTVFTIGGFFSKEESAEINKTDETQKL